MSKKIVLYKCDDCKAMYEEEKDADNCCQPDRDTIRTKYCVGCYNDYYNQSEPKHCWGLSKARVILRKEVHINDVPPWNHTPKLLPDCYRKPKYVYVGADQTH